MITSRQDATASSVPDAAASLVCECDVRGYWPGNVYLVCFKNCVRGQTDVLCCRGVGSPGAVDESQGALAHALSSRHSFVAHTLQIHSQNMRLDLPRHAVGEYVNVVAIVRTPIFLTVRIRASVARP